MCQTMDRIGVATRQVEGTLGGVSVFSVVWAEFLIISAISCPQCTRE